MTQKKESSGHARLLIKVGEQLAHESHPIAHKINKHIIILKKLGELLNIKTSVYYNCMSVHLQGSLQRSNMYYLPGGHVEKEKPTLCKEILMSKKFDEFDESV